MKTCILMASPRKEGNTAALAGVLCSELDRLDEKFTYHYLYDMDIAGCIACRRCQSDRSGFNCFRQDDMQQIAEDILASDVILFATPIYSWYCTPPLKAVMDRLVYGMNKYYGETKGPSIWAGKILAATPMDRFGEPEELDGTLLFLCDEAYSGFITGVNIPVDGGFNAYSGV